MQQSGQSNNYQTLLSYYKDKVDALERQRDAWLAKFDECASRMSQKQQKQQKLRKLKADHGEIDRSIIHHTIAKFDEQLSTLNIDRQNQNLQFEEAEQLIKMRELAQQYPIVVQKCLPCVAILDGDIIDNQLNLHSKANGGRYNNSIQYYGTCGSTSNKGRQQGMHSPNGMASRNGSKNSFGGKGGKTTNLKQSSSQKFSKGSSYMRGGHSMNSGESQNQKKQSQKKTLQQIMRLQIIQTQRINAKQIALMEQQQKALEESIQKLKQSRSEKNNKQKHIIKQFQKKYSELQKKHKELAENYFTLRRNHKQKGSNTNEQNKKLKNTLTSLEAKITQAMRVYEKQNKAKQALILKKSQDFQQDYKAKMRAKQRNLQGLKENYQKMQELCIDKVRKLEATAQKAKYQLQDMEQRKKFVVDDLREQLKQLQKRLNQQRIQKAKIDLRLKQKMQQEKQKQQAEKQLREKQRKLGERDQMIKIAYQKTGLPQKGTRTKSKEKDQEKDRQISQQRKQKKIQKSGKKQNKKRKANNAESSGEDDSLEISDLDNIKKQINELQKKIAKEQESA